MARKTQRDPLHLTDKQRTELEELSKSRTCALREIQRAKALIAYSDGIPITEIQKIAGISRPSIYKCVDKALAAGPMAGLADYYHQPFPSKITPDAKAWVVDLACTKPKDHGLAAELWSYSELAKFTRNHAKENGIECLDRASKATVWRILDENDIKPHKIKYYLEKRDPDFERKMQEVLIVYKDVALQNERLNSGKLNDLGMITVSIDEKPGVQAIKNVAPDLPPQPGKHRSQSRDYEYKRLGTVSILASLDLHTGHIIAQVRDRHRSSEFIDLLKELDDYYPPDCTIRVVLDNHSSHISKETMAFLSSRPNRFVYVHTPKHGSWLNLIEMAFSKMARSFLRHIRVESKEELISRIHKGIKEFNEDPVVFKWGKYELELA